MDFVRSKDFFIIDSDCLNDISSHLYGYAFEKNSNQIVTNNDIVKNSNIELSDCGCYIFIKRKFDTINVYQDYNGSCGIYLYKNGIRFVLSNSLLYLSDYLKDKVNLTFNESYSNAFLAADLCSFSFRQTEINEIEMLDRFAWLTIDCTNKKLTIEEKKNTDYSISLDSEDGIIAIDTWFKKWIGILRNLKKNEPILSFDLSGGFDSRLVSLLWLNASLNMDEVSIHSSNDGLHCHDEDYAIASKIAEQLNFKLNQNLGKNPPYVDYYSIKDSVDISFYTKLGFHKEMYWKIGKRSSFAISFGGGGGECVRGYPYKTVSEYLTDLKKIADGRSSKFYKFVENQINATFEELKKIYLIEDDSSMELPMLLYNETRCRNHYGKAAYEDFSSNIIRINPLIDSDIRKVRIHTDTCQDNKLLLALLYYRYQPELLEFNFEGGRFIEKETIELAKKISDKFPFKREKYSVVSYEQKEPISKNIVDSSCKISSTEIVKYLTKIVNNPQFEKQFTLYNDNIVIQHAKERLEGAFHPLKEYYGILAELVFRDICKISQLNSKSVVDVLFTDILKNYNNHDVVENFSNCAIFQTARIDVKLEGNNENNSLDLISNTDINAMVQKNPKWLYKNNESCYVISSFQTYIELEFNCSSGDNLKIWLRGPDKRSGNGNRLPIFIDYSCFIINNDVIFSESKVVSHDKPYVIEIKVEKTEKIKLHIEWNTLSDKSIL